MSIGGSIDFFTAEPLKGSEQLQAVLDCLQHTPCPSMTLHIEESKDMRMEVVRDLLRAGLEEPQGKIVEVNNPLQALNYQGSGKTVTFFLNGPDYGEVLRDELAQAISESIRDYFIPYGIMLRIGPHDIFDTVEHEDWHLFGHSNFTVSLGGDGCPHDWQRYRELVFEVPLVKQLQADLESIVGPLQRCAYWNF